MAVFNSLGSNYKLEFILKSVFSPAGRKARSIAKHNLAAHYKGKAVLTYKGREALELALRLSNLPAGSQVGINGFTCYVVFAAAERAGYEPVFIDVEKSGLNFSINELRQAHIQNPNLKAIVIQNTLGMPVDMDSLVAYCKKNQILVIEDLAHSQGAFYPGNIECGLAGEMTMLSFSQDKPLDVVAGGALIDRRTESGEVGALAETALNLRLKNRFYPFWTYLIRTTYQLGIGRLLHAALKKLHLLSTPMGGNKVSITNISSKAAALLALRWHDRQAELEHRKMIAKVYKNALPKSVQFEEVSGSVPSHLRFPIRVQNRPGLVAFLKQSQIYVGDTWYDAPIGPKKYLNLTSYTYGLCPNAEKLAETIVNLPTHINVSSEEAIVIAGKVKQWLESQ